jgi:hypothetical protein
MPCLQSLPAIQLSTEWMEFYGGVSKFDSGAVRSAEHLYRPMMQKDKYARPSLYRTVSKGPKQSGSRPPLRHADLDVL